MHLSAQDLKYSSSTIQADLDRFQRQKVADLREMTISMARSHRDWCRKVCGDGIHLCLSFILLIVQNLAAWEEAKAEIAKIPDHPNRIPEGANGKATANRRDSTATINGR